jgi:hypothetical protein
MRTVFSPRKGAGIVWSDAWIPIDASAPNSQHEPADPVKEDALAYAFYALLDDKELKEVFGDLAVPADERG